MKCAHTGVHIVVSLFEVKTAKTWHHQVFLKLWGGLYQISYLVV